MERSEFLKEVVALGALSVVPDFIIQTNRSRLKLHFVGVGSGGTNAMVHIHNKGINANYSCINGLYFSHLSKDMEFVFFESPANYRISGSYYKKGLELTPAMKEIFDKDELYIVLAGLGSSVGTGLINNLLEFLHAEQKSYMAICSLPFTKEGRSKSEYAFERKKELSGQKNVHFIDLNQTIEEGGSVAIPEMFKRGDELFYSAFINHYI
jgi:cell division GTPase FtsZ